MTDSTYTPDVSDDLTVAWDLFTASLDPVQLERERMRVLGSLVRERPGSRQDNEMQWAHNLRRLEFRRQVSLAPVPYWFAEWQVNVAVRALMNAEPAVSGAVSHSDGLNGSNSSTRSPAVTKAAESKVSTSRGKPVTTERKAA